MLDLYQLLVYTRDDIYPTFRVNNSLNFSNSATVFVCYRPTTIFVVLFLNEITNGGASSDLIPVILEMKNVQLG